MCQGESPRRTEPSHVRRSFRKPDRRLGSSRSDNSISKTGITADMITGVGIVMAMCAPSPSAPAALNLGLLFLVLTGIPDLIDGAVAKACGHRPASVAPSSTRSSDRLTDGLLFGGVAWYLAYNDSRPWTVMLPVAGVRRRRRSCPTSGPRPTPSASTPRSASSSGPSDSSSSASVCCSARCSLISLAADRGAQRRSPPASASSRCGTRPRRQTPALSDRRSSRRRRAGRAALRRSAGRTAASASPASAPRDVSPDAAQVELSAPALRAATALSRHLPLAVATGIGRTLSFASGTPVPRPSD